MKKENWILLLKFAYNISHHYGFQENVSLCGWVLEVASNYL